MPVLTSGTVALTSSVDIALHTTSRRGSSPLLLVLLVVVFVDDIQGVVEPARDPCRLCRGHDPVFTLSPSQSEIEAYYSFVVVSDAGDWTGSEDEVVEFPSLLSNSPL